MVIISLSLVSTGCENIQKLGEGISQMAGDVKSLIEPLTMKEFCDLKAQNPEVAYKRYNNRRYLWEGTIDGVKPDNGYNVVALNDIDSDKKIYAKVYNYAGQPKGTRIKLEGDISQANFTPKNRFTCHILLDAGQIK